MDSTPILNGAPAFIVLGFTVALAAYLRQVSLHAQEIIDKIKSNAVGSFPYNEGKSIAKHTKEKLQLLENTRSKITKVTRPVFVLMFFIAIRVQLKVSIGRKSGGSELWDQQRQWQWQEKP